MLNGQIQSQVSRCPHEHHSCPWVLGVLPGPVPVYQGVNSARTPPPKPENWNRDGAMPRDAAMAASLELLPIAQGATTGQL